MNKKNITILSTVILLALIGTLIFGWRAGWFVVKNVVSKEQRLAELKKDPANVILSDKYKKDEIVGAIFKYRSGGQIPLGAIDSEIISSIQTNIAKQIEGDPARFDGKDYIIQTFDSQGESISQQMIADGAKSNYLNKIGLKKTSPLNLTIANAAEAKVFKFYKDAPDLNRQFLVRETVSFTLLNRVNANIPDNIMRILSIFGQNDLDYVLLNDQRVNTLDRNEIIKLLKKIRSGAYDSQILTVSIEPKSLITTQKVFYDTLVTELNRVKNEDANNIAIINNQGSFETYFDFMSISVANFKQDMQDLVRAFQPINTEAEALTRFAWVTEGFGKNERDGRSITSGEIYSLPLDITNIEDVAAAIDSFDPGQNKIPDFINNLINEIDQQVLTINNQKLSNNKGEYFTKFKIYTNHSDIAPALYMDNLRSGISSVCEKMMVDHPIIITDYTMYARFALPYSNECRIQFSSKVYPPQKAYYTESVGFLKFASNVPSNVVDYFKNNLEVITQIIGERPTFGTNKAGINFDEVLVRIDDKAGIGNAYYSPDLNEILVSSELKDSNSTFVHEVIHSFSGSYQVYIPKDFAEGIACTITEYVLGYANSTSDHANRVINGFKNYESIINPQINRIGDSQKYKNNYYEIGSVFVTKLFISNKDFFKLVLPKFYGEAKAGKLVTDALSAFGLRSYGNKNILLKIISSIPELAKVEGMDVKKWLSSQFYFTEQDSLRGFYFIAGRNIDGANNYSPLINGDGSVQAISICDASGFNTKIDAKVELFYMNNSKFVAGKDQHSFSTNCDSLSTLDPADPESKTVSTVHAEQDDDLTTWIGSNIAKDYSGVVKFKIQLTVNKNYVDKTLDSQKQASIEQYFQYSSDDYSLAVLAPDVANGTTVKLIGQNFIDCQNLDSEAKKITCLNQDAIKEEVSKAVQIENGLALFKDAQLELSGNFHLSYEEPAVICAQTDCKKENISRSRTVGKINQPYTAIFYPTNQKTCVTSKISQSGVVFTNNSKCFSESSVTALLTTGNGLPAAHCDPGNCNLPFRKLFSPSDKINVKYYFFPWDAVKEE